MKKPLHKQIKFDLKVLKNSIKLSNVYFVKSFDEFYHQLYDRLDYKKTTFEKTLKINKIYIYYN